MYIHFNMSYDDKHGAPGLVPTVWVEKFATHTSFLFCTWYMRFVFQWQPDKQSYLYTVIPKVPVVPKSLYLGFIYIVNICGALAFAFNLVHVYLHV